MRVANYRADVWIIAPDAYLVYHTPVCLSDIADIADGPREVECFMPIDPCDASSDEGGQAPPIPPAPTELDHDLTWPPCQDSVDGGSETTASEEVRLGADQW